MSNGNIFRAPMALTAVLVFTIVAANVSAQAPAVSPAVEAADAHFLAQRWAEAVAAYTEIVKTAPQDARSWYRLGNSLLSLKKYDLAAAAFEKSAGITGQPAPMYGAAAANARLGKAEKAFDWLKRSAVAGYPQSEQFKGDENFASLRSDARFGEIAQAFAINGAPCRELPRYQEFAFFLGEWDVRGQGTNTATNNIQLITGNCILFENYTNGPYSGKSFSYFDAAIGKWRQTWVDAFGGSATFVGEFNDGAMRFEGETHPRTGPPAKVRMTFFDQGPNRLRQLGESTNDGGKTWIVSYDLTYTRKK